LIYETEAVRLSRTEDGQIDGVVAHGPDGIERTLGARAVVIASGGFEGSREMMVEHLGPRGAEIPVISPGTGNNRGEGISMAVAVGADTAGQFDMFHAEPVDSRATKPDPVIYPYPYGIVVNRHAKRFYDEGKNSFDSTFEELGYEIWRNQEQQAFFIGDQTSQSVNAFNDLIFTDVPPETAATVRELATKLGLDPVELEATVAERTASLTEMVSELQQVSYSITHDMRAPVRAMGAFAQLLLDDISKTCPSPEREGYCHRILTGADRLDLPAQEARIAGVDSFLWLRFWWSGFGAGREIRSLGAARVDQLEIARFFPHDDEIFQASQFVIGKIESLQDRQFRAFGIDREVIDLLRRTVRFK
jgi:hypothetical protein